MKNSNMKNKYIKEKILPNNKGITLTVLIITVIMVLIISGILVYTGMELFEKSIQKKEIAKLTLIQSKVKSMGEENLFNGKELVGTSITKLESNNKQKYDDIKSKIEEIESEEYSQFYYVDSEDLNNMGLDSVGDGEYLVNYNTSEIINLDGMKINGETVYKLSDVVGKLDLAHIYIGEEIADRRYELTFKDQDKIIKTIKASYKDNIESQWPTIEELGNKEYEISYDSNGGSACESQKVEYTFEGWFSADGTKTEYTTMPAKKETLYAHWQGEDIILPTSTRDGYIFQGWYDAANDGNKIGNAGESYTSIATKTLYAKWTANDYTITYEYNGATSGNTEVSKTVTYGGTYGELPAPTKTGYTFGGWYKDSSFTTAVTSNTTVSTAGNHIIYAKWTSSDYTITYEYNGATSGNTEESKAVTYGETYGELPVPTKTGYTFGGWYKESSFTTSVTSSTTVSTAGNHTIYAKWTANDYTITYEYNGATSGNTEASKTVTYDGTYGELPTPTKTGYTFGGWYKDSGLTTAVTSSTTVSTASNHTIYAKWTINSYYIDLNLNVDGTNYGSGGYNSRVTVGLKVNGVDKGYVSDYYISHTYGTEWEIYGLKLDGVSVAYTAKGTLGAEKASVYVNLNTIKFESNNTNYGSVSSSELLIVRGQTFTTDDATLTLADGRKVTASATSATGYTTTFTSWSATSGTVNAATTITASFSRTANTYTVTYNYNSATGGNTETSKTVTYGGTYGELPTPTRTGYTFGGWYKESSFTTAVTSSTTVNTASNHTIYAKWTAKTVNVTFMRNLNSSDTTSATQTFTYGVTGQSFSAKGWSKTGYALLGWNETRSATTNQYSTLNGVGDSWINSKSPSTTIYAIWKANTYTVTYNYNSATGGNTSASKTVTYDGTYGELPTPTRTGYTFEGWYKESSFTTSVTSSTTVSTASNHTIYAKWTACSHTYSGYTTTTDPTCTTVGSRYRTCSVCGYKETSSIAALGHSYTSQTQTSTYLKSAANCTTAATYYYKCSRCTASSNGDTNTTYTVGESLGGHVWGTTKYKYTTAYSDYNKVHYYKCTRDGCTATKQEAHSYYKYTYSVNGTTQHVKYTVCSCGTTYSSTTASHSYTYTRTSDSQHKCTCVCSYYYSASHTWPSSTTGIKCSKCGDIYGVSGS